MTPHGQQENRINSNQAFITFIAFFLWFLATSLSSWISTPRAQGGLWFVYPRHCVVEIPGGSGNKLSWGTFCELEKSYVLCPEQDKTSSVFDLEAIETLCTQVDLGLMKFFMISSSVLSAISSLLGTYMIHSSKRVRDIVSFIPFVFIFSAGRVVVGRQVDST